MSSFTDLLAYQKLLSSEHATFLAYGSSNTQRRLPGMTWFDYLELGFKRHFGGGCGNFLNTGVGGHTSKNLLDRFDRDLATYKPDLVIITVGGNDSNPDKGVTTKQFKENLLILHDKISKLGGQVIFQTYYGCMLEQMSPIFSENFEINMQSIREAAQETGAKLLDHYKRWNFLKEKEPDLYKLLMIDAMHVNQEGNAIMGLDLLRKFDHKLEEAFEKDVIFAIFAQKTLDLLEN